MTLYIEPHAGVGPVIAFIQQARGTLDINAYLATDRRIIQAIAQDVRRGIRVRILIDRRHYGGRPHGEIARLRATGAQVRYAPARFTQRYVFDHAKYMVSGSSFELGTANLTWSALGGGTVNISTLPVRPPWRTLCKMCSSPIGITAPQGTPRAKSWSCRRGQHRRRWRPFSNPAQSVSSPRNWAKTELSLAHCGLRVHRPECYCQRL